MSDVRTMTAGELEAICHDSTGAGVDARFELCRRAGLFDRMEQSLGTTAGILELWSGGSGSVNWEYNGRRGFADGARAAVEAALEGGK